MNKMNKTNKMNKRSTKPVKKNKEDDHCQLTKIVDNFEEIIKSDNFTHQAKNDPKLQEKMQSLTAMLREWSKACGITEYTPIDSGYTGDEVLEKYRNDVGKSWGNKSEKKNAVPKITKEEIDSSHSSYMARKRALEDKRERDRIAIGCEPRQLITDEITGQKIYVNTKERKRIVESGSSEEDDDDIIDNILKKEPRDAQKMGQLLYNPYTSNKNLKEKPSKRKHKKVIVYESSESSGDSESEEESKPYNIQHNRKIESRRTITRGRIKEFGNSISLQGLDDIHQFHMDVLDGPSDVD